MELQSHQNHGTEISTLVHMSSNFEIEAIKTQLEALQENDPPLKIQALRTETNRLLRELVYISRRLVTKYDIIENRKNIFKKQPLILLYFLVAFPESQREIGYRRKLKEVLVQTKRVSALTQEIRALKRLALESA